jgi:hypothetical protein
MLFFQTGRSNQRHRRVLHDTVLTGSLPLARGTTRRRSTRYNRELYSGRSENYGDAMLLESQTRLADLIPTHPMLLAAILAAGFGAIAVLEALYLWTSGAGLAIGRIGAFDLADRGSVGTWFSSLSLLLAAATAALVYTVRRHRLDDYRGHYRIWLWSAACWLLMSIDATANLHDGFGEIMARLTGTRLFGESSMWWLMVCGFVIAAVSLRLLIDMRHCVPSACALVGTAACYAICLAFHFRCVPMQSFHWPAVNEAVRAVAINKGVLLCGNLLIWTAMLWHARYVLLDAEGLLRRRRRGRSRSGEEVYVVDDGEVLSSGGRTVRVHPPHGVVLTSPDVVALNSSQMTPLVTSPSAMLVASTPQSAASLSASGGGALPIQRRMTKQEKKALRARLERMRDERQAG